MHPIVKRLGAGLVLSAGVAWGLSPSHMTGAAHAARVCSPVASPAADTRAITDLSTGASVITAFNHARRAEGCSVSLGIDPNAYNSATPQMKMFMLFNAERVDRGLPSLRLDSTLMSQIDYNHSREMAQYGYFGHPSPINHPGASHVFDRVISDPGIASRWQNVAENIAAGYNPGAAVYAYMYTDSAELWGHRHNILGYTGSRFGVYNWVGVGVFSGGSYGTYYTSDFIQSATYLPPSTADGRAPTLRAPAIVSGRAGGTVTARVTRAGDSGAPSGAAGLTGVVFSAGTPTQDRSGNANTVAAKQVSPGVWQARLSLPAGAVLHAVAVDGSGNYTDCTASTCSTGKPASHFRYRLRRSRSGHRYGPCAD